MVSNIRNYSKLDVWFAYIILQFCSQTSSATYSFETAKRLLFQV